MDSARDFQLAQKEKGGRKRKPKGGGGGTEEGGDASWGSFKKKR